jgi:FkbM family methyltransferase
VYAFEPWGRVRARIAEKVALNKLHNVTIRATGLGREDAVLPFVTPLDENTGQGTFRTDTGVEASETLPIARGDGWFAAHDIRPNLMKIDVEGLEPDVLAGLAETIPRLPADHRHRVERLEPRRRQAARVPAVRLPRLRPDQPGRPPLPPDPRRRGPPLRDRAGPRRSRHPHARPRRAPRDRRVG